ncbi:DUF6434 domain-containing protein [Streptomyces sp. NPDC001410]|uniref:DUF6434 domain-containing protein n=1 Tax=Streptomyces sp. NPDC001410 TaxID=3364574 RepID=UPI0036AF727F
MIPAGQRCSQVLRRYFAEAIGPGFHFDTFMRDFIARNAGQTLADAVAHWHATGPDAARPREIEEQFEFNRFTSAWHRQNPAGTRAQALEAWYAHRALPKLPSGGRRGTLVGRGGNEPVPVSPKGAYDDGGAGRHHGVPTGAATAAHHSVAVVPSPEPLPASHSSHPRLKSA